MDVAFIKGCAIGLSIAAPVGPIAVLCIRRSLADGARIGFLTGLGAATADAIYGAVAAFGLTAISGFLTAHQVALRIIGGLFLAYLGIKTLLTKPADKPASAPAHTNAFASTLLLTLTNPMTILSFMVIFAAVGVGGESVNYSRATVMTLGVFIGSAVWWLFLSNMVAMFRTRVTLGWMQQVNRVSGAITLSFAIGILLKLRAR